MHGVLETPPLELPLDPEIRTLRKRLVLERCLFGGILAVIAGGWAVSAFQPHAWAVYVDGKPVAAMRERSALEAMIADELKEHGGKAAGVTFNNAVKVAPIDPAKLAPVAAEAARAKVAAAVLVRGTRGVIYIDGDPVVALPDAAAAEAVLQQFKKAAGKGIDRVQGEVAFKQVVEVKTEPVDEKAWADAETAAALLRGEAGDEVGEYRVRSGDTSWSIARKHGLSRKDLQALNPGVAWSELRVGQTIHVSGKSEPLLTVVAEGTSTRTEPLPFAVELRKSAEMYEGKRIVKQVGSPGLQRVTFKIRRENGVEVSREPLSRQVLRPSRTQVVILGAKPRP